jgi:erythromycin esterase-like protein
MSDQAINDLLEYVRTVRGGREELDEALDAVDTMASDIQNAIADIRSDLEDKVDCVENTLTECAADIPSDESNWDYIAQEVDEQLTEKKEEWQEHAEEVIAQLEADIIAEHKLFADLCKEGYPEEDFAQLVNRLFASVDLELA